MATPPPTAPRALAASTVKQAPASGEAHDDLIAASVPAEPAIDWSSVEEVSAHVSRTTLAGMQQLWRQHAASMDAQGKAFAQTVYSMHSDAVRRAATLRTTDLQSVVGLVNEFTSGVREALLDGFQSMRTADDSFAQATYQATRRTFAHTLKTALDARGDWYLEKLRSQREAHDAQLAMQRAAMSEALSQQAQKLRREMDMLRGALRAQGGAAAAVADAAVTDGGDAGSAAGSDVGDAGRGTRTPTPDAIDGGGVAGMADAACELAAVRAELVDLLGVVEGLDAALALERAEVASWRGKWAAESANTDAIKRECAELVARAEQHVAELQGMHMRELGRRDEMLRRCRDTIENLEAQLGATAGGGSGKASALFAANM
uniref:Uncharacterized protein n=1 Tax=Chlamydomonas euryale TaxID=1486919 RepID=A0A7R9Z897_9CHLO|mmetsp:Transcript_7737/g.23240  ORF Transcript_7737/g.23240 Transcript_7737/m.23240 type:complete len:376 (+) Transcript_7737:344-1471(+)